MLDKLLGEGYTKAEINKMKRMGYGNKEFQKLLKGRGAVGGNMVGGKSLPKAKLQQRLATIR